MFLLNRGPTKIGNTNTSTHIAPTLTYLEKEKGTFGVVLHRNTLK